MSMKMDKDLGQIKIKGYLLLRRELNHMLFDGRLTFNEIGLFVILLMNADWDSRHTNYGKVVLSNNFIGHSVCGLNRNKVGKIKKALIRKKLIKTVGKKDGKEIVDIYQFNKYQPKVDWKLKKIEDEITLNEINQLDREI